MDLTVNLGNILTILASVVSIVVFAISIRESLKYLNIRQNLSDEKHREHYEHEKADQMQFSDIKEKLAVIQEKLAQGARENREIIHLLTVKNGNGEKKD